MDKIQGAYDGDYVYDKGFGYAYLIYADYSGGIRCKKHSEGRLEEGEEWPVGIVFENKKEEQKN